MNRAETIASANRFIRPGAFSVPQFLVRSSWLDHAPFAFALMDMFRPESLVELGTHNGYSYFAFCEAAKRLGLSTRCYAVDTWEGDEHAGRYTEHVFQMVDRHNEANYASFSRLVRATFDEAVTHFPDGSIDLLHIDGRHFYEDVKHDFETWVPKLSERAVVLFHDINVRERGFGAFKLWEEISAKSPSFAFHHGHGLGVLGYGKALPAEMARFFTATQDPAVADELRNVFARLGSSIKAQQVATEQAAYIHELLTMIDGFREDGVKVRARIDGLEKAVSGYQTHIQDLKVELVSANYRNDVIAHALDDAKVSAEAAARVAGERIDHLTQAYEGIQRSLSWRITAPIRAVRRWQMSHKPATKARLRKFLRAIYHAAPVPLRLKRLAINAIYSWWRGMPPHLLRPVALPADADFSAAVPFAFEAATPFGGSVAAIVHVYYDDLAGEVARYLRNIPVPFDTFICTDTPGKRTNIQRAFANWDRGGVQVRLVPNRGRDIAPKLLAFRDVYDSYEFVLHLHTKSSSTAEHLDVFRNWRGFIFENLVGSPEIVASVLETFARHRDVGMIAAQHFEPIRRHLNWGDNFSTAQSLAARMGLTLSESRVLDFPSGSMFWARSAALKPLLDLNLRLTDFPAEAGQMDGTIAHAIERLYFFSCEAAQLKWMKIANPPLFNDLQAVVTIDSPATLVAFIAEHTFAMTGPNPPVPAVYPPPPPRSLAPALIARLQNSAHNAPKVTPPESARPIDLDFSAVVPFGYDPNPPPPRLAAICHVYYETMAAEFQRYLRNIPFQFDVFISTDQDGKKEIIEAAFAGWDKGAVEVRVVPNRGRDIAPKLVGFADIYPRYDYVLHLHTKASDHADVLATWRGYILENVLGSPAIVRSVFETFARHPEVGMVACQHFEPVRHWINWGGNFPMAKSLADRMGFELQPERALDFPSGSMFWARTAALKPLLDLNLTLEDFVDESGQVDATPAHAIERLYFHVCDAAGYRWLKIANPALFGATPAMVYIASPEDLDRFVAQHTPAINSAAFPPPRKELPTPIERPVPELAARLQARALGTTQPIDTRTTVTVGIVTYNNPPEQMRRVVGSALTALARAGLTPTGRIAILDNGVATADAVGSDPAIGYLPTAGNVGFGAGHNRLMKDAFAAGSDIYIATNPDGLLEPEAIGALVQMMAAYNGRALIEALQFPDEHPKVYDPYTLETPWVSGACLAISRAAYDVLGGFDETFFMYGEDVDMSWRARAHGLALRVCPRALFLHGVTNRAPNPDTLRMVYQSMAILGTKWGNEIFTVDAVNALKALDAAPSQAKPTPVPESWQRIADFSHKNAFAATRW